MKAFAAAAVFVAGVALWPAGPGFSASVLQAPPSGLSPVDYSTRLVSYGSAGDEKIVAQNTQVNDLVVTKSGGEIMSPTALTLTPDQAMLLVADGMDRSSTASRSSDWKCPRRDSSAGSAVSPSTPSGTCGRPAPWGFRCASSRAGTRTFSTSHSSRTQGGRIFRRETKRVGVVAWEPVKPPQPGL